MRNMNKVSTINAIRFINYRCCATSRYAFKILKKNTMNLSRDRQQNGRVPHNKFRSSFLSVTPVQMQCYCRVIVCEELAQGPYTVTVSDKARTRTLRVTGRVL